MPDDLESLIALYAATGFSTAAGPGQREAIWTGMLASDGIAIAVAATGSDVVATATMITAPNLLRGGRSHGFLENVATHPDWRSRGFGRAVVRHALDRAWAMGCHHVLLQSGRPDPGVHRFYREAGFVPGLRIGYVASRPGDGGS